jgi:hypothetical protein
MARIIIGLLIHGLIIIPAQQALAQSDQEAFEHMLNDLKAAQTIPQHVSPPSRPLTAAALPPTPLSLAEEDALRSSYTPCWDTSSPIKEVVTLDASYDQSGTLTQADLDPSLVQRYNSEPQFRAASDNAMRAVRHPRCNPLRNLPPTMLPKLQHVRLVFDPRTR